MYVFQYVVLIVDQVKKWRDFRVNDKIDFRIVTEGETRRIWRLGRIENVDREKKVITVKNTEDKSKELYEFDFERCVRAAVSRSRWCVLRVIQ